MRKKAVAKVYVAVLLVAVAVAVAVGAYAIVQKGLPVKIPGLSPSLSPTPVETPRTTLSPTATPAITASPTSTLVPGPTPAITPTPSPSASPTPTPTPLPIPSPTPTQTPTPTSTPTPSPTPTPTPSPVVTKAVNWAGYIVASDLQNPQPNVTSVSGSWIVPAVAASTNDTFSAIWIGVGGQFDRTLIQCGTQQDLIGDQTFYSAWYELLPRNSITIRSIIVSPGDQIQASIQLVDATLNEWSINIADVTAGLSFQNTFGYVSSQLSADWIVERPDVNNVLGTLANFGNVTFTNCQASIGSLSGGISNFPANEIVMYSSTVPGVDSVQLTDVSGLTVDGAGFTVDYLTSG